MRSCYFGTLILIAACTGFAQTDLPGAIEQLMAPNSHPNQIVMNAQVQSFIVPGENGSATITALRDGTGSVTNTLPSRLNSRTVRQDANQVNCTFEDKHGSHKMAGHNCLQDQIWEEPYFLAAPERGPAIYDGKQNSLHFMPQLSPPIKLNFHAGYDLVIGDDGFPSAIRFAAHPDKDSLVDIATEYRYSEYRIESGVYLPHTIEKYVNGGLALRYQVQSVVVN